MKLKPSRCVHCALPRVIKKVTLVACAGEGMAEAEDCGIVSMEEV